MENYLPLVKDIIVSFSALTAAIVAVRGLNAWKRQLSGKAEYEVTQRLLKATYKLREAIRIVRSPVMFGSEMPEPPEDDSAAESEAEKRFYGVSKAYEKRWDHVQKAHIEIEAELLEAEVLWGAQIRQKFSNLFSVESDLIVNIQMYIDHISPNNREPRTSEEAKANRMVLYAGGSNDAYYKKLLDAITMIENELKSHLKSYR